MRRPPYPGLALAALAYVAAPAASARAATTAPLLEEKLDVDGDGRIDTVTVQDDGRLVVLAAAGTGRFAEIPLGVEGWRITAARVEFRAYAAHRVLLVHVSDVDASETAALIEIDASGKLTRLWQGVVGPQGRDREWAIAVALGDMLPIYYETKDGVARCDGEPTQLARRGFDFGSGEWRALGYASPLPPPRGAIELRALRGVAPPGLDAASRPGVFHATAASSSEQDGGSAEDLTTPTEIDDGKLETAWAESRGSHGRGEFVTVRSKARPFKVVALRLVPGDAGSADTFARANRLRRVQVVTDAGAAFVVVLDPDPAAIAGPGFAEPYWITLPQPVAARCVSVIIDDVWPGKPGARAGKGGAAGKPDGNRTAIAELAVFTDLDAGGPGALDALAENVATGDASDAQAAEDLLVGRGGAGAGALVAAAGKPGRRPEERRRVRLALARLGDAAGAPEVAAGLALALAPAVVVASESGDAGRAGAVAAADNVRERDAERLALGLRRMGAGAAPALAVLLADDAAPLAARTIAAELLGAIAEPEARAALEAGCGRGKRALRQAVTLALGRRDAAELPAALDAALAARAAGDGSNDKASAAANAAERAREADLWRVVALLAPRAEAGRDRVAAAAASRLAASSAVSSTDYELRHRLVETLAAVVEQPTTHAPLEDVLTKDAEPALRLAVVTGLARAEHVADLWAGQTLVVALADSDPGVRAAALGGLAARSPDEAAADPFLVERLDRDTWPDVRRAAATALGRRCARAPAADALFGAIDRDTSDAVRRVALAALVRCKDARIGEKLLSIAGDPKQPGAWRQFAAVQLGVLADRALVPRMLELLASTRKDAFDDAGAMWVAAALAQALGSLADPRATAALIAAAEDPSFWPVQAASVEALGRTCPPRGRRAARAALGADNGRVVGAARRTVKTCGW